MSIKFKVLSHATDLELDWYYVIVEAGCDSRLKFGGWLLSEEGILYAEDNCGNTFYVDPSQWTYEIEFTFNN